VWPFTDPDGNVFEPMWMNPAAMTGGAASA
jgi:predicted lactoylglutathione lyase